jgi:hypothetical protein
MSSNYLPNAGDVLSVIKRLGQQNAALELTNSFKEIVLKQDVNILEVNPDYATFRATNIEMCAALEEDVFLHNQLFPKPVMARLKGLSLNEGMLVLSDFTYRDTEWKERKHERVRPKNPSYVTLRWKRRTLRAPIENISASGMGVIAYKPVEKGMRLQPGSTIHLDFQLPPNDEYTGIKGTVIYLHPIGECSIKLGIQLFPKASEAQSLEKYIAQRKREIMGELELLFLETSWPRGVEHLYF